MTTQYKIRLNRMIHRHPNIDMQNLPILSVSELNTQVRLLLELNISQVLINGEVSNLSKSSLGHYYFSLKDQHAQIRCAYFATQAKKNSQLQLHNGQQIIAYGKVSLYEPRGDYQLIITSIQDYGLGQLYQDFLKLKTKLEQQGLFSKDFKKSIPRFPKHIAIITSPKGAALHDIVTTLQRRYPLASHQLYASEVQGIQAPQQLIAAIQQVEADQQADVIILARGGGSLEDLWSFNHEDLAHAIFKCCIPIISGIGHETDFTIADFVADLRAATPSIAAELATPNQTELQQHIQQLTFRLTQIIKHKLQPYQQLMSWYHKQSYDPEKILIPLWQKLDLNLQRLQEQILQQLTKKQHILQQHHLKLQNQNPYLRIAIQQERIQNLHVNLQKNLANILTNKINQLQTLTQNMQHLSPLATLNRGYAIVSHHGRVLEQANQTSIGSSIHIQLSQGKLTAIVEQINE